MQQRSKEKELFRASGIWFKQNFVNFMSVVIGGLVYENRFTLPYKGNEEGRWGCQKCNPRVISRKGC